MNLTCQIHTEFDSNYIKLFKVLNHSAQCDQCEHLSVAHIAHNICCKHSTGYKLHCTCDTVKTCA